VSVKFYVDQLFLENGVITHIQAFKEISNPNNRFDFKSRLGHVQNSYGKANRSGDLAAIDQFPQGPKGLRPEKLGG